MRQKIEELVEEIGNDEMDNSEAEESDYDRSRDKEMVALGYSEL